VSKLEQFTDSGPQGTIGYMFLCPGCKLYHAVYVLPHRNNIGAGWEFNGDMNKPTFRPSILTRMADGEGNPIVCHSFVTDGQIQFLNDCTHELAGQTVELPDVEK
jgi:hypothetical protein